MTKRIIAIIMSAAVLLSLTAVFAPAKALAADKNGIVFDCEYSAQNKKLTVTASVVNPDAAVSSGMFVLKYDKDKLTASKDGISFVGNAKQSAKYFDADEGYIGADWYYSEQLPKSSSKTPTVKQVFDAKNAAKADDLKNSLSVCTDTDYLNSIGGYGADGGVLLCTDSTHTYSSAQDTATATFNYTDAPKENAKNGIIFDCVYDGDKKTLTVTASVDNSETKVGAAMFVLDYDGAKLSVKESDVTYLGDAVKSKTYLAAPSGSSVPTATAGQVGADWYYNTALPASTTPTKAVQTVFTVKDGVTLDDIKNNALAVCDNEAYLKSLTYEDDGGILLAKDGTTSYNVKNETAYAKFNYLGTTPDPEPKTYKITVKDGTASVDGKTVTTAKVGDKVTITANDPASGKKFSKWQKDSGSPALESDTISVTSFVMPANDVALTAIFADDTTSTTTTTKHSDDKYYNINAINGYATVGGNVVTSAKAGQTVVLHYNKPSGNQRFDGWIDVSDNVKFKNVKGNTGFVMPAEDVVVEARYVTDSGGETGGKTGDDTNSAPWIIVLALSAAIATMTGWQLYRRRNGKSAQ